MTLSFVICCKGNTKIRFGKENEDFINWDIISASFATGLEALSAVCRISLPVSSQLREEVCEIFANPPKPPYLCIVNQTKQHLSDKIKQ